MGKIAIPPDANGYTWKSPDDDLVSVKLDGGFSRTRRDLLYSARQVDVQWTAGPAEYEYLVSVYNYFVQHGGEPFQIDLIIEDSAPTEYTAKFVAGSFGLQEHSGHMYVVGATLEVQTAPATVSAWPADPS